MKCKLLYLHLLIHSDLLLLSKHAVQDGDVGFDEGDAKTLKEINLLGGVALFKAELRSLNEGCLNLGEVSEEV